MPHFSAPAIICSKKASWSESGCPPLGKSSNNRLAVKPETENDVARESCSAKISRAKISVQAAARAKAKGFIENV
jgi:hypothetical protein